VEKRITGFEEILIKEEGSGSLRWAIDVFVKLKAQLAEMGDFRLTPAQQERIDSLLQE